MGQKAVHLPVPHAFVEPIAALYAAAPIPLNLVSPSSILTIRTPLIHQEWNIALSSVGLLSEYEDDIQGIRYGFDMGIKQPTLVTFTPPNHSSARINPSIIDNHIKNELSEKRYTGPFSRSRLELLIGPFRSSPLGLVPKAGSIDVFRIIQDLSFPRDGSFPSVNEFIDSGDFPCEWGSFSEIVLLIMDAPPGTEVATLDVDAAFCHVSILPSQQHAFIIMWDKKFYVDSCAPFGATSSSGVFGRIADALVALYKAGGWKAVKKWVDDFLFFRYPQSSQEGVSMYSQSLNDIYSIAAPLGWPWKPMKTQPFSDSFLYLGFQWSISARTVAVPKNKCIKFLKKLDSWRPGHKVTKKEIESILGSLVHCSLAMPDSRSHLPSFSRFAAAFQNIRSPFVRLNIPPTVLEDISWWHSVLAEGRCQSQLQQPPLISDILFAVDASTSGGIGVVLGQQWESWRLLEGWNSDGRNIGWAEMVAVELGIRCHIQQGANNAHFRLHSDNMGVIFALDGGRSCSVQQNQVLQWIVLLLRTHNLWVSTEYIKSADNPANPPSHNLRPPFGQRLPLNFSPPLTHPLSMHIVRCEF